MSININLGSGSSIGGEVVMASRPRATEAPASATATAATASAGEVWVVTAEADVFLEFAAAPNGSGAQRWRIKSGSTRFFAAHAGDKAAWAAA